MNVGPGSGMLGLNNLFDDRIEVVAAQAGRTAWLRFAIALPCFALMAVNLGLGAAGLWGAVFAFGELWTWSACSALKWPGGGLALRRLYFLGSNCTISATWCLFGVLYWTRTGSEALHLAGVAAFIGVMVHGQCFCNRSPLAFALMSGPPAILFIAMPLLYGHFHGIPLVTAVATLGMAVAYVAAAALIQARSSEALERAEHAAVISNRAKTAFLAMMSHELRTPMNGVLGMAYALRQTALSPSQADKVEMLIGSGDGLMAILNDLLDVSKIEAGKLELEHSVFDLRQLVGRVETLWAEVARERSIGLDFTVADDAPRWLAGDPTRLRQIIINLVSNALKFTERGGVRVTVAARPTAREGVVELEIRVADDGIGMSADEQARLFQSFSQANTSISRRFGGAGLGLVICRQLANMMDGDILVASRPGAGSVFTVTVALPVAEAPGDAEAEGQAPSIADLRVLLAEDNPVNQAVARAILEATGAVVSIANDGVEALERLSAEAFDVVLMDVHMPRMDGIQALAAIRAGKAGIAPDLHVIAFTADAMSGEGARLLQLGFNAVQTKPIQPYSLLTALAESQARPAAKRAAAAAGL
jgi:signal transduction histidine kinase/ActR/RegA family two-component response regulator